MCSRILVLACLLALAGAQLVLEDEPGASLMDGNDGEMTAGAAGGAQRQEAKDPMTRMLQWGMENSDLDGFAKKAQLIREGKMAPEPVDRQAMDLLFGSKASFLEKVVGWVKETVAAGDEDKIVESLEELENQVTDIDNAGDLDSVGGVDVVLELIDHPLPKVQQAALWVVGTTVQSHLKMQEMIRQRGALPKILSKIRQAAGDIGPSDPRLLAKALYAISTLLRSCAACIQDFALQGGGKTLADLLNAVATDGRNDAAWSSVRRKIVTVIGDLLQEENVAGPTDELVKAMTEGGADRPPAASRLAPMLRSENRNIQEAALTTVEALLSTAPSAVSALGEGADSEVSDYSRRTMATSREHGGGEAVGDLLMLASRVHDAIVNATRASGARIA